MHFSFEKARPYVVVGLLLIVFCCSQAVKAMATDVSLAWNPNPAPDLSGYKLYYGTVSHSYGTSVNVGNVTTYTVKGLGSGNYYFALTAFDGSGKESSFSNEVSTASSSSLCDVNGDGASNALDLQTEINAILAGSTSPNFDVNRDGTVNALDLQKLGNVVLGVSICQ
jgi:hypothetical protein